MALPPEFVDLITEELYDDDLFSLRLTCREMARKAELREEMFWFKDITMTTESLTKLAAAMKYDPKARLLEYCTIIVVIPVQSTNAVRHGDMVDGGTRLIEENNDNFDELLDLLTQAFCNLSSEGGLEMLRLEATLPDLASVSQKTQDDLLHSREAFLRLRATIARCVRDCDGGTKSILASYQGRAGDI